MDTSRNSDRSRDADDMDLDDDDFTRRGSTVSTIRSPSQADIRLGAHVPVIRKQSSPTSANQRLVSHCMLAALFGSTDVCVWIFGVCIRGG